MHKKNKKPIELMDEEWGRLSLRICAIISGVMESKGLTKSSLADRIQYAQSAMSDVFSPDDKRGRKRRWSLPLLMAVCRELDLYLPEVVEAAWGSSSLTGLRMRLKDFKKPSRECLNAVVQAVAPGNASDEMRSLFYNVDMFELAAPECANEYYKGKISEEQIYAELNACAEEQGSRFWAAVKTRLTRGKSRCAICPPAIDISQPAISQDAEPKEVGDAPKEFE